MPRAVRIEIENAVYHVMARGNHREDIVRDDGDRRLFLSTLEEVCGQTGWRVFAWVLMSNHFLCGAPHKKCYVQSEIM